MNWIISPLAVGDPSPLCNCTGLTCFCSVHLCGTHSCGNYSCIAYWRTGG